jgi:hypothetical protein
MSDDLVYRLRKRAEIRRQISTRKSVQEGKPDRIADLLEEAADELGALAESANSTTNFVEPKTPVQPEQDPTKEIYAVLFAVEEAVRNGCAPWDIEAAFEKYEAKLKEIK